MPPLTLDQLSTVLDAYVHQSGKTVDLLLVGALALQAYEVSDRATHDIDGELVGELEPLVHYLGEQGIPADLGETMSGWPVMAMPPGYRSRGCVVTDQPGLTIRLLAPIHFIVAKLRRGTDLDLDDATLVARRFNVSPDEGRATVEGAIAASPKDTAPFFFRETVDVFLAGLDKPTS